MIFGFMTLNDLANSLCLLFAVFGFCGWLLWKRAINALKNNPEMQEKMLHKGKSMLEEYLRKRFGG